MSDDPSAGLDASELRKLAGQYLKELRLSAGLSQRDVAVALEAPYYTIVSQIEAGRTRLPTSKISSVARLFDLEPHDLAKRLMQFYDPHLWEIVWGPGGQTKP